MRFRRRPVPRGAVALVTGASSGLGRAIAVALARDGAQVVVHGRDERRLARTARDTGGIPIAADLADPAQVRRLADEALRRAGRVDVLVHNAGVGWAGRFTDMPDNAAGRLLAVDLAAPIALTRSLLPPMLARGSGSLLFVTSIAGRTGVAGEAVYAAAKAGLDAFAESLRLELRGTGVTVGVLVPGVVDTDFFERRGAPYERRRPRPLPPERVAEAAVRAVAEGAAEVHAPRWLRLPVVVKAAAPGLYRTLAGRFGEHV
ncbi:oxidoreductase [Actinomadura rubrobrunea]|uniref:Oxidoreductase n=1 Tax=Actinomadura rubrobrunea TaxID=115335 RepID=A0A9W6Q143_9ACTN|nr:SDR family oxidoreductase [Actinomadura rubrobrunea]GLW66851.1 oxidoreductase [Actinomadura rubrobrunea]